VVIEGPLGVAGETGLPSLERILGIGFLPVDTVDLTGYEFDDDLEDGEGGGREHETVGLLLTNEQPAETVSLAVRSESEEAVVEQT